MLLGDKKIYIKCTVEFKIKGNNSVNDTEVQKKLLGFQCELTPKSREIRMNSSIKMCSFLWGVPPYQNLHDSYKDCYLIKHSLLCTSPTHYA